MASDFSVAWRSAKLHTYTHAGDSNSRSSGSVAVALTMAWEGWPDWSNFRLLGDCFLWVHSCFQNYCRSPNYWATVFHGISYVLTSTKNGLAVFVAVFSQAHLVTLTARAFDRMSLDVEKWVRSETGFANACFTTHARRHWFKSYICTYVHMYICAHKKACMCETWKDEQQVMF
jgi:hypothetical protein